MTWAVSRMGRAAAVAAKLADDFKAAANAVVDANEKKIIEASAVFLATALAAHDPAAVVNVSANGSLYQGRHHVAIGISPIHEFIE